MVERPGTNALCYIDHMSKIKVVLQFILLQPLTNVVIIGSSTCPLEPSTQKPVTYSHSRVQTRFILLTELSRDVTCVAPNV